MEINVRKIGWAAIIAIALMLFYASRSDAQTPIIVPTSPTGSGAIVRNLAWGDANKVWILKPATTNVALTVTIRNRNTTSAHTGFFLTASATKDDQVCNPVSNGCVSAVLGWQTSIDGIIPNDFVPPVQTCALDMLASGVGIATTKEVCKWTFYGVKQIALQMVSAATAAGSPDTLDMFYSWIPVNIASYPLKWFYMAGTSNNGVAPSIAPVNIGGTDRVTPLVRYVRTDTGGQLFSNIQQGNTLNNNAPTVSAANTAQTKTLAGVANSRNCIRSLAVKATGAAATSTFVVQVNGATIIDYGTLTIPLNGPSTVFTGTPLICGGAGDSVAVVVGAGGAAAVTTLSVVADQD